MRAKPRETNAMCDDLRCRLRAAYDAHAKARDRRELPQWKRNVRAAFLETLRHEGRTRLLEVGAGTGHDGAFFAQQGLDVVCVDLSSEMVRLCREKGLEAHVMDVVELRFPAAAFDAVYSFNGLLHLPKAELPGALREVHRVLRPGGPFFFGVYGGYNHEGVWEDDTYDPKRFFSFRSDEALLDVTGEAFDVASFDWVAVDSGDKRLHFQSLVLRSPATPPTT